MHHPHSTHRWLVFVILSLDVHQRGRSSGAVVIRAPDVMSIRPASYANRICSECVCLSLVTE